MMLPTEILNKLKDSLPSGYGPILRDRLALKDDIYTLSYIYMVFDPNSRHFGKSTAIIDEAIAYIAELNEMKVSTEEKILALTK